MAQTMNNRRVEPRALTAALIKIKGRRSEMAAVLEDLSSSGASLYVERKVRIGDEVSLTVGNFACAATVKHAESCNECFRIGIQFLIGKWPGPISLPVHWIRPS